MNKQQAKIALAIVNKLSKQTASLIALDRVIDAMSDLPNIVKVKKYRTEFRKYMDKILSDDIVSDIEAVRSSSNIWGYLLMHKEIGKETQILLREFATLIDELKSYASAHRECARLHKYKSLIDEFANDETLSAMQRATDAGLLTDEFKPNGLTMSQARIFAWAIGKIINIPCKKQYVLFERQWGCECLRACTIPEKDNEDIAIIKKVFPEVDFAPLTATKEDEFFDVEQDDEEILTMFMSLIMHKYIDSRTSYTDFIKVFGRGNLDNRIRVNWIRSQRCLAYFVYITFRKSNYKFWEKAKNCFVINGSTPHKGSMKTGLRAALGKHTIENYDPILYNISRIFNKKH